MPKPEKPKREQPDVRQYTRIPEPKEFKSVEFNAPQVQILTKKLRHVYNKFDQLQEPLFDLIVKLEKHFDSVYVTPLAEDQSIGLRIALVRHRFKSVIRLFYNLRDSRWYMTIEEDGATRRSNLGIDPPFGVILRELKDLRPVERIMLEASVVEHLRDGGHDDIADSIEVLYASSDEQHELSERLINAEVKLDNVRSLLAEKELTAEMAVSLDLQLRVLERRVEHMHTKLQ
jgi:hypothetical protein